MSSHKPPTTNKSRGRGFNFNRMSMSSFLTQRQNLRQHEEKAKKDPNYTISAPGLNYLQMPRPMSRSTVKSSFQIYSNPKINKLSPITVNEEDVDTPIRTPSKAPIQTNQVPKKLQHLAEDWRQQLNEYSIDNRLFDESKQKKLILEKHGAKTGVVITTHGNNGVFIKQAIERFVSELPKNRLIILYINESDDPLTLEISNLYPEVQVVIIKDQVAGGGLTGTWNKGITECIKQNCDVIIVSNDDIVFDSTLIHSIYEAYIDTEKLGSVYCPVSNAPGPGGPLLGTSCPINRKQLAPGPKYMDNYKLVYKDEPKHCNGFFMVFPKHTLLANKFDEEHYFDPKYPFGKNELEWCNRFISKGGYMTVVPKTFIYHYKNCAWRKDSDKSEKTCMFTINTGGYDGSDILISSFVDLPFDKLYFTDSLKQIYNCLKENVIPFYASTVGKETKLVQRIIKTSPHLFIPALYDRSIYIDGNVFLNQNNLTAQDDILRLLKYQNEIIHFSHPDRNVVIEECKAIIKLGLEREENIRAIVNAWKDNNFNDDYGLTETNVLVRYHKKIIPFSESWTRCINICRRDQVSFDYLRYLHSIDSLMLSFKKKTSMFSKIKHANPKGRKVVLK